MKPGDKVYVTKYALSIGIGEGVADEDRYGTGWWSVRGYSMPFKLGREVHATWPEAKAAVETMRAKKIASLKKQLQKLEKLEFKEPR